MSREPYFHHSQKKLLMSAWGDGPGDASNPAWVAWVAAGRPRPDRTPGPYRRVPDRGPTTAPDPVRIAERTGLPTGTPHQSVPQGPSDPNALPPGSVSYDPTDNGPYVSQPDGSTIKNPNPGTSLTGATRPAFDGGPGAPATPTEPVEDPLEKSKREADDRARRDAYARLQRVLEEYGLGSLGSTVQSWLVEGLSEAEIVQRMRETTEFKTRFPAIEQRKKKGLAPISPGEYVAYERQARQMMRAAGIPEGFYDGSDDFTNFLNNDLSLAELGDRVTLAANAAFKMPKEARDKLAEWGFGPGDATALWLDPDKALPLLERKQAAATLAGTGTRTGWGSLSEGKAGELVTLGVTDQQAEQGFGNLVQSRELFGALDRGEDVIGQEEQLGAAFKGNAAAQRRIESRRRRRQGQFEGGGSFAGGQGGLTGLGDVDG